MEFPSLRAITISSPNSPSNPATQTHLTQHAKMVKRNPATRSSVTFSDKIRVPIVAACSLRDAVRNVAHNTMRARVRDQFSPGDELKRRRPKCAVNARHPVKRNPAKQDEPSQSDGRHAAQDGLSGIYPGRSTVCKGMETGCPQHARVGYIGHQPMLKIRFRRAIVLLAMNQPTNQWTSQTRTHQWALRLRLKPTKSAANINPCTTRALPTDGTSQAVSV